MLKKPFVTLAMPMQGSGGRFQTAESEGLHFMSCITRHCPTLLGVVLICLLVSPAASSEERRIILYTQTPGDFLPENNPLQPGAPPEYERYAAPLTGVEQIPSDAQIKLVAIWTDYYNVAVPPNEWNHTSLPRHLMFYTNGTTKFNPEDWYLGEPLEEHYNLVTRYQGLESYYGVQDSLNRLTNQPWTIQDLMSIQIGLYLKWPAPPAGPPGFPPPPAEPAEIRRVAVLGVEVIYEVQVPELTVSSPAVSRGGSATFTVTNATGATISNWKFTPTGQPPVARTTNMSASTWPGQIVVGGTASVTVVKGGVTYNLSKSVDATPRSWSTTPVQPTQVPNGTFVTLPSPPSPGSAEGFFQVDVRYNFSASQIGDNGPNHGYVYVVSYVMSSGTPTVPTRFRWEMVEDVASNSAFFRAQCGNYNRQTMTGYIAGSVLRSNITEHESGTIKGHYQQYLASSAIPGNDIGALAEPLIAAPGTTLPSFIANSQVVLNGAVDRIVNAAAVEACNADIRLGPTCAGIIPPQQDPAFAGFINFAPYLRCR